MSADGMTFRAVWTTEVARIRYTVAANQALTRGAGLILQKSNEIVPFDEGILEASGMVDVDAMAGKATVSYDTPYAVAQHENTEYNHDFGRKAKYLQSTMDEHGDEALDLMARVMRESGA